MTVAMMLPTALPLVLLFRGLTAQRARRRLLVSVLIAGYLGAWVIVGVALHVGDALIHVGVDRSHWMQDHAWAITAGVLLAAGAYQFSPLKYLCLDECRSPYTFIAGRWRGGNPVGEALKLGFAHGWFCVGCCWTLMILMFALGSGSLVWMLAIGTVMAVEKNTRWGRAVSAPLGALLLAAGLSVVLLNVGLQSACAHDGAACQEAPSTAPPPAP
jgi:predicted metal-binding membrane protein